MDGFVIGEKCVHTLISNDIDIRDTVQFNLKRQWNGDPIFKWKWNEWRWTIRHRWIFLFFLFFLLWRRLRIITNWSIFVDWPRKFYLKNVIKGINGYGVSSIFFFVLLGGLQFSIRKKQQDCLASSRYVIKWMATTRKPVNKFANAVRFGYLNETVCLFVFSVGRIYSFSGSTQQMTTIPIFIHFTCFHGRKYQFRFDRIL